MEIVEGHLMPDHVHLLLEIPLKHGIPEGLYVSTVGLNTATVGKYIREQEMHDQMVDKLNVKEDGDPFSNATKRKRSKKGK